ncbi:MAG TPA: TRAP transporter large permease [Candidatus Baltobacteraceae bacterium]|nr:TRAP transporter large permease [Candidatus Baltobacteraceae bacterium]
MTVAWFFIALVGLMALNVPIAFCMAGVALGYVLITGTVPIELIVQRMISGTDSFVLLAIPFFLLAGSLMNAGGVTHRLMTFARSLVGHITGGLAHVTVVTNMIMAGMSGSAVADCSGTGAILIPAMIRDRYSPAFAAAITATAATIGPIIPPSIPMVIYAAIVNVSVARMFVGGFIPGVLMGLFLMTIAYVVSKRRGYPKEPRATLREMARGTKESILALLMPAIVLGGILLGIFTPTEAAVVAALYAFVLGAFVYRELKPRHLLGVAQEVIVGTASAMLILAGATPFGWLLASERAPQTVAAAFSVFSEPWMLLLAVNILLLILGCFMEAVSILIILSPVLAPIVAAAGINDAHFGVILVLNLMIGTVTPPVGILMYIVCRIANVSIVEFAHEAWFPIVGLIAVLFLITYVPPLVTWLPNLILSH